VANLPASYNAWAMSSTLFFRETVMATVVMDHRVGEQLQRERAIAGSDRWDEVWDGTYMMVPLPNIEHQDIVNRICAIFQDTVGWDSGDIVLPGTNVSDREKGWEHNYRCPDVVVYLAGTRAKKCNTHWCGGPDLAVEIVSDDDRTRDKIPFYSKVGTRELLVIDRDPWSLELLRLSAKKLKSAGTSAGKKGRVLQSRVLPLNFRLISGQPRPSIEVVRSTDGKTWKV
jgi:Uma2 family endonuclease